MRSKWRLAGALGAGIILPLTVVKLAALVSRRRAAFAAGAFSGYDIGAALGILLRTHVEPSRRGGAMRDSWLGAVVTRDGWLQCLFMAAVVVPDTNLLPLLLH